MLNRLRDAAAASSSQSSENRGANAASRWSSSASSGRSRPIRSSYRSGNATGRSRARRRARPSRCSRPAARRLARAVRRPDRTRAAVGARRARAARRVRAAVHGALRRARSVRHSRDGSARRPPSRERLRAGRADARPRLGRQRDLPSVRVALRHVPFPRGDHASLAGRRMVPAAARRLPRAVGRGSRPARSTWRCASPGSRTGLPGRVSGTTSRRRIVPTSTAGSPSFCAALSHEQRLECVVCEHEAALDELRRLLEVPVLVLDRHTWS